MTRSIIFLVLGSLSFANAQECTSQWDALMDTDPDHPKTIGGDTNAAYALFSFWGVPNTKFVLKGNFPNARFMSFETNETRWGFKGDALFDFEIEPDSENPNAYTVEVIPDGDPDRKNVIRLGNKKIQESVLFRIYSPNDGIVLTKNDLPRIFAYNIHSGKPAACPTNAPVRQSLNLPQFLTFAIGRKSSFDFKKVNVPWGPNSAIPYYLAGPTRMREDDIAIIRFKAPFFGKDQEVRYWSLCSANFVKLTTLNCLPDYLAKLDRERNVTLVFGKNKLRQVAEERGFTFLEDTRAANQTVAQFVYRNILPSAEFAENEMYEGAYLPHAILCSENEFLLNSCQ